ncbi:hypothetical protein E4U11_008333 [Claviceps purpurea]|nr:hypothetical protein E4U11_008333 [Claviceps purpurea]
MNLAFNFVRLLFQKPCGAGKTFLQPTTWTTQSAATPPLRTYTTFLPRLLVYFPHKALQDRLIVGVVDRPAWKLPLGGRGA